MADKIESMEARILHFLRENLDELSTIRQEESERLENVKKRASALLQELRTLAADIDRASKEYDRARAELMQYSKGGLLKEEKDAYKRASELMSERASLEERYRLLSQRKEDFAQDERSLERLISKSERMGNRLRMVMNLIELPDEIDEAKDIARNKEAMATAFQIAEREARFFARELHDGPTQTFSAVGLTLEMVRAHLERGEKVEAEVELDVSLKQLRNGLDEIRCLLFNLAPTGIEEGFEKPLERLSTQVRQTWKAEMAYVLTGNFTPLENNVRIGVFKTLHQAVLNAVRAGAKAVKVSLGCSRGMLRGRVVDNGKGFDVEQAKETAKERGSYGLINMQERVEMLGGKLLISSFPGKGSTLSFSIPLLSKKIKD
ncbi:MAG: hypothetical protein GX256_04700 [Fretibacterium sp.]|nr:hypothetical protein [Fretibacterium sp.]